MNIIKKTLDHNIKHTSLRPRKLSIFIVIVHQDDEHNHYAARHCNAFVYSSPRHNNDKTSENTLHDSSWTCRTHQRVLHARATRMWERVKLHCSWSAPVLCPCGSNSTTLLNSVSWSCFRYHVNSNKCWQLYNTHKSYVHFSLFLFFFFLSYKVYLFVVFFFFLSHTSKNFIYIHWLCYSYASQSITDVLMIQWQRRTISKIFMTTLIMIVTTMATGAAAAIEVSRTIMTHLKNRRVDDRWRWYLWTKRERPLGIRGRLTLTARLTDYSAPGSIGPAKRLKVILSSERLLGPTLVLLALSSSVSLARL